MRDDLQNAYNEAKSTKRLNPLLGNSVYEFVEKQLMGDEHVLYLGTPNVGILSTGEALKVNALDIKNKTAGVLLVTSKRILHCAKVLFNTKVEQISLENINNFETKGGLIFSVLRIQSMTNVMEIDVPKWETDRVSRIISEAIEKTKSSKTPQNKDDDVIEKLKQLGELRNSGVLTDEDFSKKKAELLSRI